MSSRCILGAVESPGAKLLFKQEVGRSFRFCCTASCSESSAPAPRLIRRARRTCCRNRYSVDPSSKWAEVIGRTLCILSIVLSIWSWQTETWLLIRTRNGRSNTAIFCSHLIQTRSNAQRCGSNSRECVDWAVPDVSGPAVDISRRFLKIRVDYQMQRQQRSAPAASS